MNKYQLILPVFLMIAFASCSSTNQTKQQVLTNSKSQLDTALVAKLSLPEIINNGSAIEMAFTVYNPTNEVKTFCKWHTPFEPLMSKYLDITSAEGVEANYKGPMAKRMMPPPADSYLSIKPKDSLSVKVDLAKAYEIKAGNYTIKYNSGSISGLTFTDSSIVAVK